MTPLLHSTSNLFWPGDCFYIKNETKKSPTKRLGWMTSVPVWGIESYDAMMHVGSGVRRLLSGVDYVVMVFSGDE